MKRSVFYLSCCLLGAASGAAAQEELDFSWRNYGQLTAERLGGANDGVDFGADRVRTRLTVTHGRLTGGVMLDFGVDDLGDRKTGALANVIGDLYANYTTGENHVVRFGQFKTPLGMDFNVAGRSLDITKRGMEAGLVLQRDLGIMLSGRRVWSGFGYDIGLFNPAGRSPATAHLDSQEGKDNAPVVRAHYDTDRWHVEAAYGRSKRAGGPATEDYRVNDVAVAFQERDWNVKAEWIEGRDIRGVAGWSERVYFVHGAYRIRPTIELVARHYDGKSTVSGSSTNLGNTYLGFTKHFAEDARINARLQVNYVIVSGDEATYTGLRAYRDNAILLQLQLHWLR